MNFVMFLVGERQRLIPLSVMLLVVCGRTEPITGAVSGRGGFLSVAV